MKDITTAEKEQIRISDEEMDDIHGHNSEGCYGQGTYLTPSQKHIDVGRSVLATHHEREECWMLYDWGGSQTYIIIE